MMHSLGGFGGGMKPRHMALAAFLVLAALIIGCSEPVNAYRTTQSDMSSGDRILVMPFMDARTFTDPKDPYRENLGEHARDIFVAALKEHPLSRSQQVIAPAMPKQEGSITIAEAADIGRSHGADYVISGQVFSYTETRAASIPPRAGMFVRVVSVKDGSLAFVGDHYQSASVPGASGGRELQARQVARTLIENMAASANAQAGLFGGGAGSTIALASILPGYFAGAPANNESDFMPAPPPPLPDFLKQGEKSVDPSGDVSKAPAVPKITSGDGSDDFYNFARTDMTPAAPPLEDAPKADPRLAELLPPPTELLAPEAEVAATPDTPPLEPESPSVETATAEDPVEPVPAEIETPAVALGEPETSAEEPRDEWDEVPEEKLTAGVEIEDGSAFTETVVESSAAWMSGDDLAADLFEEEGALAAVQAARYADQTPVASPEPLEVPPVVEAAPVAVAVEAEAEVNTFENETSTATVETSVPGAYRTQREYFESVGAGFPDESGAIAYDAAPVVEPYVAASAPIVTENAVAVEQPTPVYSVDRVEQGGDSLSLARNGMPVKVLLLPYHDRENPDNLIPNTGGGEVVTALFGSRLATERGVQILWAGGADYSHRCLATAQEAIEYGRRAGVDYVVRGQVVEFRRAQSVPSFYSVVISTVLLAAQIFFAEISGVDVATEVYRVSDGMCVMSRRDHSQQKYVVQAEKTVRRLANSMAADVVNAIRNPNAQPMDPVIDTLVTTPQLASLH